MTRRELIDRRIAASATVLSAEHLHSYCDIYRTPVHGKDNAGAPRQGRYRVAQGVRCGVVPTSDPVEVTVAGRTMGFAEATVGLPDGTDVRETDEIHVRKDRLPIYEEGNPAYTSEHDIFTAIGTDDIATHGHLLNVYVARRR
jgi:hypothetical protein